MSAAPGHGDRQRRTGPSPLAFEAGEEECAVVLDRAASRAAVVAVLERTLRGARKRLEEIPRVQFVVAQKLVQRSVEFVGAGLDDRVDHRARIAAVLGGSLGLDAEFGQRIDREQRGLRAGHAALVEGRLIAERIVVIDAVDQEDIRLFALAIHGKRSQRAARGARSRARHQECQFAKIAAVQRQLLHLAGIDHFGQSARIPLQNGRFRLDIDGLFHGLRGKRDVDARFARHVDFDLLPLRLSQAGASNRTV